MTPVRRPPPGAGLELPQRQSSRYTDILNWYMLRRSIHDEDYEDYDDDDDDGMGCSSTYVPWSNILDSLGRGHPKHGEFLAKLPVID